MDQFYYDSSAGNGNAGKEWPEIEKEIESNFPEHEYVLTERPGHATELARNGTVKGFDTIVSCGGDGTLNEVINGVAGSEIRVALIPLGTGSDFVESLLCCFVYPVETVPFCRSFNRFCYYSPLEQFIVHIQVLR